MPFKVSTHVLDCLYTYTCLRRGPVGSTNPRVLTFGVGDVNVVTGQTPDAV